MSMTLEDLLRGLEKQAADQEGEKEEKKEESKKEDDKKEDSGKKENPFEKMKEAEKDTADSKDKEDRVKEAHLQGAALAQEIMQKVASAQITTDKEPEMNKSASVAGKALAASLLEKLASAGDMITTNGIPAGVVPNKSQVDNSVMVAEHDARVQTTPTTDAKGDNGGSVNQIFDAIVADAMGAGAATPHELGHASTSAVEGAIEDHAAPGSVQSAPVGAEVEKAAAVSALVNSGFDFASAVEMVKAAEEEILFEEDQQTKQAAMNELINSGVDFELAAALVKEASLGGVATRLGRRATVATGRAQQAAGRAYGSAEHAILDARTDPAGIGAHVAGKARAAAGAARSAVDPYAGVIANDARAFGQGVRQAVTGKDSVGAAVSRGAAARRAAGTATGMTLGAAGAGAAAGGAYALTREKQAAVNGLVDAGVDFDSAVALVNDKAAELYGA